MKILTLILAGLLLGGLMANAQNLYNTSNAASIENESNGITGWSGNASITSDNSTAQNGLYSIRAAVQGNGREARYSFTAQTGSVYNISIWARRTGNSNNPAFANWLGLQGFTTTVISSQNWTQYNFTVTATLINPTIRIYAGPIGAISGMEVFIDAITILPETPPDLTPPTPPSNLIANSITTSSADISWSPSTDNIGVVSYTVYQNSNIVANLSGSTTSYSAINLTSGATYSYTVTATDAANNVSQPSDTLAITTLIPPPDTLAPSPPMNLLATSISASGFTLSWTPSVDNVSITNYIIWQNSSIIANPNNTTPSYTINGLTPQTSYSYYLQAQDGAGNISLFSDTLQVTTNDTSLFIQYSSDNANLPTVNWQANNFFSAGNTGIGTAPNSNYRLSVNGTIRSKEIIVESGWSDFVFEPGYYLPSLADVEQFIIKNGHLQDIPPASEVMENGIGLAKMNTLLLQKIEEITLYLITADKRIQELEKQIAADRLKF